ncbi:hypothetical protein [Halobellus sp. GM3]|uniref:hypothetical protein n=1 Tax=Halobellus sp. GM3 TaxID=3458410 RepID=UPI00403D6B2C
MDSLPFPLSGRRLVTGPSNVGKTRLTARALEAWVGEHGSDGVTALDFAPELERDGRILGGRLTRFSEVPETVWYGVVEAHAPRAAGETESETLALAAENARRSRRIVESAPENPRAVFVNDATIPFQSGDVGGLGVSTLFDYYEDADFVVCNAFESDELGVDDRVSRNERAALGRLRAWADSVVER